MSITILCVDDEEVILTSLERFMERNFADEYAIEMAQSGEDALEIAQELKSEGGELGVIVCDYIMPNMKGDAVLGAIHEMFPDAKTIMLTGQASLEGVENAINKANLYRFIQKPWGSDDLFLTIQEALKGYMQVKKIQEHTKILEHTVEERTSELKQAVIDLKSTQGKLIETEKMAALGKLVAGVAHEINTPVGVCVTASSTLKNRASKLMEEHNDCEGVKEQLAGIAQISDLVLKNIQKANELIKSFKKVATDQSSEQAREVELCSYLHEIAKTLHPQYSRSGHQLEIACEEMTITTRPGPFAQVITNLVMNSLIHGFKEKKGGHITISLQKNQKGVIVRYGDDGCGIDNAHQKRVFEPFFTTNRGEGSGLGLHIVYNLVTIQLGGGISLDPEVKQGVGFEIALPLKI